VSARLALDSFTEKENAMSTTTAEINVGSPVGPSALDDAQVVLRKQTRERRQKLLRNLRHGLLALGIAGASVAVLLALRPQPVPVDPATVTRGALAVVIEESGVTRVKDRFIVSAPVTGSLSRLSLEPGDPVKEGDPLAEIAPALSPARTHAGQRGLAGESGLGASRIRGSHARR